MTYLLLIALAAVAFILWSRPDFIFASGRTPMLGGPGKAAPFPGLPAGIERFEGIGLRLSPGIQPVDLESAFDEDRDPWWSLFFVYGIEAEEEPWDRRISPDVWNFDNEFIEGPDSYEVIVANHAGLTGRPDLFDAVEVEMPEDIGETGAPVQVRLKHDGEETVLKGVVNDDWVDTTILSGLRAEIARRIGDGRRFWAADNGQAEVLAFLSDAQADSLNALRPDLVRRTA